MRLAFCRFGCRRQRSSQKSVSALPREISRNNTVLPRRAKPSSIIRANCKLPSCHDQATITHQTSSYGNAGRLLEENGGLDDMCTQHRDSQFAPSFSANDGRSAVFSIGGPSHVSVFSSKLEPRLAPGGSVRHHDRQRNTRRASTPEKELQNESKNIYSLWISLCLCGFRTRSFVVSVKRPNPLSSSL